MTEARRTGLFLVFSCAAVGLILTANLAHAESLGAWTSTTGYPTALAGLGCAVARDTVYCVGGFDSHSNSYDDSYYAPMNSASSIGPWAGGTVYPVAVDSASCVTAPSDTMVCVGGEEGGGQTVLNSVYYAEIPSSTGPGSWVATATYPLAIAAASCVVAGGYIYCVGGFNGNGDEVSNTYYAPVGSSGLGSWVATTPYPKAVDSESCVLVPPDYIVCIAGEVKAGGNPNNPINSLYYAQLTASGIGKWSAGPSYPASLAALSCVNVGDVFCIGGFDANGLSSSDVYYADLNSPGSGTWTSGTPYPTAIDTESCVAGPGETIYCVGGVNGLSSGQRNVGNAYIATLGQSTSATTTPEFPAAATAPIILVVVLGLAGVLLRRRS